MSFIAIFAPYFCPYLCTLLYVGFFRFFRIDPFFFGFFVSDAFFPLQTLFFPFGYIFGFLPHFFCRTLLHQTNGSKTN